MIITSNDPSAGYVSWSGVTIKYKGVTYTIADDNSNKAFIWWDFTTPTVFLDSATMPTLTDNDFVAIYNDSGTYQLAGIRSRQVHGGMIMDGTIPETALEPIFASDIDIVDDGGYYTGIEVETALQEIGAGTTLDTRYLLESNNLSDLDSASTARTNLGLIAGGAGDIWVEKAGDTMSGDLLIYDPTNDGNPQLRIGSADANEGHIQAVYGSGTQILDYLLISTDSAGEGDIVLSPASGFVGIGTTSPAEVLDISGVTSGNFRIHSSGKILSTGNLLFDIDNDNSSTVNHFTVTKDNAGTTLLRIQENGNVGIGTASPLAKVHIDQSVSDENIPVLYLDQADVSEPFVRFDATEGVGNCVEDVGAKTLTVAKFLMININGTDYYLQAGTIA